MPLETFLLLWQEKRIVLATLGFFLTASTLYIIKSDVEYSSQIRITPVNVHKHMSKASLMARYHSAFQDDRYFVDWKRVAAPKALRWEDIRTTETVENFVFEKEEKDRLINFSIEGVSVSTNDVIKLSEIHSYLSYLNAEFSNNYISAIKKTLNATERSEKTDVELLIWLEGLGVGKKLFTVGFPTWPEKTSPRTFRITLMSTVFGLFFGACFAVLFRNIQVLKERYES